MNRNSSQICFSNILLCDMQKIWHAACSTAVSRHRETSSCERNCVTAGSGYYFRTSVWRVPATLTDVAHHLFLLCLEKFTLILKKMRGSLFHIVKCLVCAQTTSSLKNMQMTPKNFQCVKAVSETFFFSFFKPVQKKEGPGTNTT